MTYKFYLFFFFFSSRRRHTRCGRDWSSDVCSSDLLFNPAWHPHARFHDALFLLFLDGARSEEHTSELQSRPHLVCRLLLEKKKKKNNKDFVKNKKKTNKEH